MRLPRWLRPFEAAFRETRAQDGGRRRGLRLRPPKKIHFQHNPGVVEGFVLFLISSVKLGYMMSNPGHMTIVSFTLFHLFYRRRINENAINDVIMLCKAARGREKKGDFIPVTSHKTVVALF